jgi:hypothetical protein
MLTKKNREIFFLQQIYWLSWVVVVLTWCISNAASLHDVRTVYFAIGLALFGYAVFVFLPFAVKWCMVSYRKTEHIDKIRFVLEVLLIDFVLWFVCLLLLGIFMDWYEKLLLMIFMNDIEINDLPIFSGILFLSLFPLSIANAIGFYGVNKGYFRFSIFRMIVSAFFFSASMLLLREHL